MVQIAKWICPNFKKYLSKFQEFLSQIAKYVLFKLQTVYESSCTTKYTEKEPGGKLVGETSCEKLPVEICGAGCSYEEGEEECHDTTLATVVDVPEEVCDLNPQKVKFSCFLCI